MLDMWSITNGCPQHKHSHRVSSMNGEPCVPEQQLVAGLRLYRVSGTAVCHQFSGGNRSHSVKATIGGATQIEA